MIAAYRNGEPIDALPLNSRAAHYGDGVFTTMRVHAGRIAFWSGHRQRLIDACAWLNLSPPDWNELEASLARRAGDHGECVLKVAFVPRSGGRGYARAWPSACDVYLFVHALPVIEAARYREGVGLTTVRTSHAASADPGIKTLSRLDEVMIASERVAGDQLCCDRDGFVLAAGSSNVFALFGKAWITPPTGRGVIAGVMRAMLLASPPPGFSARVQAMHREALNHADALILCNAVRGLVAVRELDAQALPMSAAVAAWMRQFHPDLGLPEG